MCGYIIWETKIKLMMHWVSKRLLYFTSSLESDFLDKIKFFVAFDSLYVSLIDQVKEGKVRCNWNEEDIFYFKWRENRDSSRLWATMNNFERKRYCLCWVSRCCKDDVSTLQNLFLANNKRCHWNQCIFQFIMSTRQDGMKERRGVTATFTYSGKLWASVLMDFICWFPKVEGKAPVMVVVEKFSKYDIFIVSTILCSSEIYSCLVVV